MNNITHTEKKSLLFNELFILFFLNTAAIIQYMKNKIIIVNPSIGIQIRLIFCLKNSEVVLIFIKKIKKDQNNFFFYFYQCSD